VYVDGFKLIHYPALDRCVLFDLREDPGETHDLSGNPAHAERVAVLWRTLKALQAETGDPLALH